MNPSVTSAARVYFVDDDPRAGELWLRYFSDSPYECRVFRDPREALHQYRSQPAELIITDLRMPYLSGIELVKAIRDLDARVPVIVITAYASLESAIEALRLGATDFIKKPYDMDELGQLVARTLDRRRQPERKTEQPRLSASSATGLRHGMVGDSCAMQTVYKMIDKLAGVECSLIIQGESGTGKELAARAIHDSGPRHNEPFVVIDCGSVTDSLLESELFGHRRGAFTGAERERMGLLQTAGRGTVFLDELGNISDAMQAKLLRVLQEGTFTPVGGSTIVSTAARFIAATNRDLRALVDVGHFRLDLFHRLNVVTLVMPPLRERPGDIPALIDFFAAQLAEKYQRPMKVFSPRATSRLCRHKWEGNVRELRNCVERCFIMSEGDCLDMEESFPEQPFPSAAVQELHSQAVERVQEGRHFDLEQVEEHHIREVLDHTGGNQSRAAEILGIHRTTLWRKLRNMPKEEK